MLRTLVERIEDSPVFRLVRVLEVAAVLVALVAFYFEMQQRQEDRIQAQIDASVRAAQLYAQMADMGNRDDPIATAAFKRSAGALAHTPSALRGIVLAGSDLSLTDFSEADFTSADLRGVNFCGSDLRNAKLDGTILRGTKFIEADISGASLLDLQGVTEPAGLVRACADPENPPDSMFSLSLSPCKPRAIVERMCQSR